ncbi:hypothetical protein FACS1894163_10990 [Spirochaetia bacterium]|nr:hypothetical protein FACS1894163_10990 [Spirochaetia bacterium]
MIPGVYIEKGPQDWQVIQQKDGAADIVLSGLKVNPGEEGGNVYARVTDEESGLPIAPWQKADREDDASWSLVLRGIPAGGLYRVETCLRQKNQVDIEWSRRGDMIHHIGIGDVYVIAGQSNAAGYGKDFVYDPPEPGIHLLRNSGKWDMASHPFNDSTHTVHEANSEGANPGHSPYLAFARRLKKTLRYPIGLMQASLGASPLSAWNPEEDGTLYRNMLDIIASAGGKVKGILWYQGCSDTGDPRLFTTYGDRFSAMVAHLRNDLQNPCLPVLTVQLSRCTEPENSALEREGWSALREAQRIAAQKIENLFVISSLDVVLSDHIHISAAGNLTMGDRLAAAALKGIYALPFGYGVPALSGVEKTGKDTLCLAFENVYDRLFTYDAAAAALPFEVVDNRGVLPISGYEVRLNTLTLHLDRPLGDDIYISGGVGKNPEGIMPIDMETHAPILSFYRFPVKYSI